MANKLPPLPLGVLPGSTYWNDWYEKLRTMLNSLLTGISWSLITGTPTTFAGYGIADNSTGLAGALSDETGTGVVVFGTGPTLSTPKISDSISINKASGSGIKIDTAGPVFGYHDLLGAISIRGSGAADPAYHVYNGSIRGYQFAVNDEVFIEFHMPHDYAPGTDLYLHFHWSHRNTTKAGAASGTVTGGTVTWGAEVCYAKGHNQAAFPATVTTTKVSTTATSTARQHYIDEVQLSASTPSGSQIDTDDLEIDGLILCRVYLSANNITVSAGSVPDPFLHFVDIHYQSTGIPTKGKAPNFYS